MIGTLLYYQLLTEFISSYIVDKIYATQNAKAMQNTASYLRTIGTPKPQVRCTSIFLLIKLTANSSRYNFAEVPRGIPSFSREPFAVLSQGITILRIDSLVLPLYVKFELEVMIERWRE